MAYGLDNGESCSMVLCVRLHTSWSLMLLHLCTYIFSGLPGLQQVRMCPFEGPAVLGANSAQQKTSPNESKAGSHIAPLHTHNNPQHRGAEQGHFSQMPNTGAILSQFLYMHPVLIPKTITLVPRYTYIHHCFASGKSRIQPGAPYLRMRFSARAPGGI